MATATKSRRERDRHREKAPNRLRPLSREDICNVEPVRPGEAFAVLAAFEALDQCDFDCLDDRGLDTPERAELPTTESQWERQPDPTPEEIAQRYEEVLAIRRAVRRPAWTSSTTMSVTRWTSAGMTGGS